MIELRIPDDVLAAYETWWEANREEEEAAFQQNLERKKGKKDTKWCTNRHRTEIRRALDASCHCKCAYCERRMDSGGGSEEIEHFLPKSHHPNLALLLSNMLLSCRACNVAKGAHVNKDGKEILNPYDDHPLKQHLRMDPETLLLEGASDLGKATVNKLYKSLNCNKAILKVKDDRGRINYKEIKGALPHRMEVKAWLEKEHEDLKTCTDRRHVLRKLKGGLRDIQPDRPLTATLAGLWLHASAFWELLATLETTFPDEIAELRILAHQKSGYSLMPKRKTADL